MFRRTQKKQEPEQGQSIETQAQAQTQETPKPIEFTDILRKLNGRAIVKLAQAPSLFMSYPEGAEIYYVTFDYNEIRLFSETKLPLHDQYRILLDGITTKGFDKNDITMGDFIHIGVLRKISDGIDKNAFALKYYCPSHGGYVEESFAMSQLGSYDLSDRDVKKLPIVVEFDELGKQSFMPITIGNYIELSERDLLYSKREGEVIYDSNGSPVINFAAYMAMQMTIPFEQAYAAIRKISNPLDKILLERVDTMLDHGLMPIETICKEEIEYIEEDADKIADQADRLKRFENAPDGSHRKAMARKMKTKQCGQKLSISLVGGGAVVIPFCGYEQALKDRISFE